MNEYVVLTGNVKKNVTISDGSNAIVDDKKYKYELTHINNETYLLKLGNKVYQLTAERVSNDSFSIYVDGNALDIVVRSVLQEKAIEQLELASAGKPKNLSVKAPMPGMILKIKKSAGESVVTGESIIILEAMKMENDIHSPADGKISSIAVLQGNAVEKGTVLFTIE